MNDTAASESESIRDHRIPVEGGTLFARAWPGAATDQPPIILLHDSLGSVELWREFPGQLARATGRRVIAYDRLGFGKSSACNGPIGLDFVTRECARHLPCLRAALGIDGFVLFGHSVGGAMALAGAADFGSDCAAVITEAAPVFAEEQTLAGVRTARGIFVPGNYPYERLRTYHGDKIDWVLSAWIDTWLDPRFADFSLAAYIKRLKSPVLALHGGQDEYGSARHGEMIGELSPLPATVKLLPECGHFPHRERPDLVLEAVTAVLCFED